MVNPTHAPQETRVMDGALGDSLLAERLKGRATCLAGWAVAGTAEVAHGRRMAETGWAMRIGCCLASVVCLVVSALPACASHLVTGNGFGFAVVSPESGAVTKFYAHPYSFERPDERNPLSEGVPTANFLLELAWKQSPASMGGTVQGAAAEYEADSQVIHTRRSDGEGFAFMPFGLERTALVVSWSPAGTAGGAWQVTWSHAVSRQQAVQGPGGAMQLLSFDGIGERLLLIPLGGERVGPTQTGQILSGSRAWALISIEPGEGDGEVREVARRFQQWRAGLKPGALMKREVDEMERWRVAPGVHFTGERERHLWRQSETMLRMAQSREPNRAGRNSNGMIVASLPDGVWFTPWVRDMAWSLVALTRMGHQSEARAGLLAYFNARPTGKMRAETAGADYQISVVRYFGDGSEEPFFTEEGATNIEFDDWGEVLWVLGEYERRYNDRELLRAATWRGPLYESARDFVVKPLVRNMEPIGAGPDAGRIVATDTSIWEEHEKDARHFAFSTAMAIVGLQEFAEVAQRAGDEAARRDALSQVAGLQRGFRTAFLRGGKLHGTLEEGEKNDIDGALLAMIHLGVVTDPAIVRDTVERMALLKVDSGGYRRVRSNYTDPAIFEYWYERQEFVFVDFSLAEVYREQGRGREADAVLRRIEEKAAADHNILPEMYVSVPCKLFPGNIGDPTGALPMVGYGAGEFILHLVDRERFAGGR